MLMAISLAEKLGSRNLLSFSLHPGVIGTNLGDHIDWNSEFSALQAVDKQFGNPEGWKEFDFRSPEAGAATHVYAAFEPTLSGKRLKRQSRLRLTFLRSQWCLLDKLSTC
jgi:NAD(P)-dependent dehydrogenase (short-subunit alcohol dehydrogenase family)